MIDKKIAFAAGFNMSGEHYGDIQAHGDVRNVLTALLMYFTTINPKGHTDSHHGTTINLVDYPFKIKFGQFGMCPRKDNDRLGLIFDGSGNWYSQVNEHGNSDSKERFMGMEAKKGLMKILTDLVGEDGFHDKWNHEQDSTGFSVVLKAQIEWTQHEHNNPSFKQEIVNMVESLNKLAKSFATLS